MSKPLGRWCVRPFCNGEKARRHSRQANVVGHQSWTARRLIIADTMDVLQAYFLFLDRIVDCICVTPYKVRGGCSWDEQQSQV